MRLVNPDGPEAADLITELTEALRETRKVVSWCIDNHDAPDTTWEEGVLAQIDATLAKTGGSINE